jgi:Icc-related predicted phosphoesterase
VCLKEEKSVLQKENKDLTHKLKSYLVAVNMTSGHPVHNTYNHRYSNRPSSVKIERIEHITISSKNEILKRTKFEKRPVTCIEGNLSNAVRHLRISSMLQTKDCHAVSNRF